MAVTSIAFDRIAPHYDTLWTRSAIGRCQRNAVWRWLDPLIQRRDRILDLGCGTGEDALHMMNAGAEVCGLDASAAMVRIARGRGVDARHLSVEALTALSGNFNGAISNFGVLNCVRDLKSVSLALSRLVRPGGFFALCVMGSFCAWETCYFLARGNSRKAFRRFARNGALSASGVHVTYPSVTRMKTAFHPEFRLTGWTGIGLSIPPSYVDAISPGAIERFARIDRCLAHWPLFRGLADHRLLLFTRV